MSVKESTHITELLNATIKSINNVITMGNTISKPAIVEHTLHLNYGVLIGFVGEIKGKLIITGELEVFSMIGEKLFGMPLEGEMLKSFTGELGNMIAGGISTDIGNQGVEIDITSPTIIEGDSVLSGYKKGIQLQVQLDEAHHFELSLLIDD
ncbi:CheY-P phosphatase CheX [Pullulanibacillus camelliae]|uniref:CheY-P phosphatase CheX n=1 Tax=Pullulanibacillus camelliae TaxID=1707096 RepID=A0A8J2YGM1_9BACL|nr:chemotaxis protein CheX [Pullulanibacillus camelliae]GGE36131.1 CheY-P phosphatase CheX [Pullulanibacillus camelliae]